MIARSTIRKGAVLFSVRPMNCRTCSTNRNEQKQVNLKGKYDVIIAGGGMVGCTLACSFGKDSLLSGLKVLLLEGSSNKKFHLKEEYSNRVVALNQNTKALMNSLNIWRHVESMRLQPVRHMQVWDSQSEAAITFDSSEIMGDDVAYIVENDVLLEAVNRELNAESVKNVDVLYGAKIDGYELATEDNKSNLVKMNNGDVYSCDLLVGADGAGSAVRRAMGVQYVSWDYDQMGVVATVELCEESANTTAWQRFLPSGPVALLPLSPRRSSLVWSAGTERARELLALSDEAFVDALNDAMWKQHPHHATVSACTARLRGALGAAGLGAAGLGSAGLGAAGPGAAGPPLPPSARAAAARAAFPLAAGHSTRYARRGVVLVGDAAHRVHPLAGQGVNLGFGDVRDLSALLADNLYAGLDVAYPSWLERYESQRQRHNIPTQLAIEAIHRLYCTDAAPVVLARSLGLQLTNAFNPIKKLIMAHAVAS